jgi:hypothetical protein
MKYGKSLALMALGAGTLLAYQRYNKPVMQRVKHEVNKTVAKTNNKLENMM